MVKSLLYYFTNHYFMAIIACTVIIHTCNIKQYNYVYVRRLFTDCVVISRLLILRPTNKHFIYLFNFAIPMHEWLGHYNSIKTNYYGPLANVHRCIFWGTHTKSSHICSFAVERFIIRRQKRICR